MSLAACNSGQINANSSNVTSKSYSDSQSGNPKVSAAPLQMSGEDIYWTAAGSTNVLTAFAVGVRSYMVMPKYFSLAERMMYSGLIGGSLFIPEIALFGGYKLVQNILWRVNPKQYINAIAVGPQLTSTGDPMMFTGGSNTDKVWEEAHYFNGNQWQQVQGSNFGDDNKITNISVNWDKTQKWEAATGLKAAYPYTVVTTNYGEVRYYDPSRNSWFELLRPDNKGDLETVRSAGGLDGLAISQLDVQWQDNGDPKIVIGTNNAKANGAEVYYYDGTKWTNFGVKTKNGDWGSDNGVTVMRVLWPDSGTPSIVAATNYGEVKYYNPSQMQWVDLITDNNKGTIADLANGKSIHGTSIGALDVNWQFSGDPQVVIGTSRSGDNSAEIYYYNGSKWDAIGYTGDQLNNWYGAATTLSVNWYDSGKPSIVAGTSVGQVKYFDPARDSWFEMVRPDNKGNTWIRDDTYRGHYFFDLNISQMAVAWIDGHDPRIVIGTNNSGYNGAEVYYYDGSKWDNLGVTTGNGDWGANNAVTTMKVLWPVNNDKTAYLDEIPYIIAGTNYGEVYIYDHPNHKWRLSQKW